MLTYFGSIWGPCWAYLGLSWRCWRYVGRMLAFLEPHIARLLFPPKKEKRSPGLWALACPMLGPCWTHVGVSWVDVGPMLSYFGSMLGPCWAYLGLSWRCWRYLGRMLALPWPSYCGAPFSFEKKRNPGLWVLRGSFSIFTPRAMSSQLRCTCQLSGRGASAMPL